MVKIFLSKWIVPSCCAGGHYNWRLSVDFDVAKDHRKQRFIQSQPYPRKCLTSSSSQALECDKRLWPFDPEHEPTCVQHATDHLIVRNFTSLVLVHKTIFDRLPFLLASYWQFISLKRWPDDSDSVSVRTIESCTTYKQLTFQGLWQIVVVLADGHRKYLGR